MRVRLLLLLAIAALLLVAYAGGAFETLDAAALRVWLRETRPWGPLLYVLFFALFQPFGFPGIVLIFAAIAVWPALVAWLLIWAGCVGAGIVAYSLARWAVRDWVAARLPERLRHLDTWVERNALRAVILVRFFFFLFWPAHWALGLTRVSFGTLVLGSLIGFLPQTLFLAFAGAPALAWLEQQPREVWGVALALVLVIALGVRRWRSRRAQFDAVS